MKLSSYLDKNLVCVDFEPKTKKEMIVEMIDKISKKDKSVLRFKEKIKQAMLNREDVLSTAIGESVAIPHARVEGFDDFIIAISVLRNGILCETNEKCNDNVKLVFMIISNNSKNRLMLKSMSAIAKLVKQKDLIKSIINEKEENKILEIIKLSEVEVCDTIEAQDIMHKRIKPVNYFDTVSEIVNKLVKRNISALPVIDEKGKFIGEITEREILKMGMPGYTDFMKDLDFMTIGEPFEDYFKNENLIKVGDIYRDKVCTIDKKTSVMEMSFKLINEGKTRLYVVEHGNYLGTVFRSDIIKKVLLV